MIWRHAGASDVNGLAAELAFRLFLAFIPFFVVVATVGGMIGAWAGLQNPTEHAFNLLAESLSPEVAGAIRTELEQVFWSRPGGLLGAAVLACVASFSRWLLALLILLLQAALTYRVAPSGAIPWRWATPGAVVFAIGWLCASALFALYADLVGAYTAVFGVLGGVVVLLVWFQLTGYALLIGAELNAALTDGRRVVDTTSPQ